MAALQTPGDVISIKTVDVRAIRQVAKIYTVRLRSAEDTIVVPGLASTNAVGSLTTGITVAAGALTSGQNTVTITGGALGTRATFATLHRVGMTNNLTIDENP
tara:strand:+ start:3548 stop:3856 length:309 start_codon:yes stop_codon:yes gene_type:complete